MKISLFLFYDLSNQTLTIQKHGIKRKEPVRT